MGCFCMEDYHVFSSSDLTDCGAFIPLIPQELIINKKGQVVEKNALRPST